MTIDMSTAPRCASVRSAQPDDLPAIEELLQQSGLPTAAVGAWLSHFLVADSEGEVVAVAGLESYGPSALLRSVAVNSAWRGSGLARQLIDRLLAEAQQQGVDDIYLLTTTAEHYFPRLGFACCTRDDVPGPVQESVEFREACPASAVVMRRTLSDEQSNELVAFRRRSEP
jgi:amino-acid N-acetyltransferase